MYFGYYFAIYIIIAVNGLGGVFGSAAKATHDTIDPLMSYVYQAFGCLPELRPMWGASHTMRALKTLIWHARIFNPVVLIKWLSYNQQIGTESTEITEEFLKAVQSGDAALNTLYASFGTQSPMATPKQST